MCSPCLFEFRLHLFLPFTGSHRARRTFLHVCIFIVSFVSVFCISSFPSVRVTFSFYFRLLYFYPETMIIVHVYRKVVFMSLTLNTYMQLTELMVVVLTATSSLHVKIDVCPGDDLQTFYPSEADG